jgi:hypothetical protein
MRTLRDSLAREVADKVASVISNVPIIKVYARDVFSCYFLNTRSIRLTLSHHDSTDLVWVIFWLTLAAELFKSAHDIRFQRCHCRASVGKFRVHGY